MFYNMVRFLGLTIVAKDKYLFVFSRWYPVKWADFEPDINTFTLRGIIVTCNVVQDTIFAGERLNPKRLATNMINMLR